jgi:molybdenum cofactor biosynthesis enzyme MoaA
MDIRFTKVCSNKCVFCIEKDGLKSQGVTDIDAMLKQVKKINPKSLLILGGEPFLLPTKLLIFVSKIRDILPETKIYITTALPTDNLSIYFSVLPLIDGLNCSVHHYTSRKNNEILKSNDKIDRLMVLKHLLQVFPDKIRVNINLIKDGLNNKTEIDLMVSILHFMGCKNIKFNELQNSDLHISFEKIMKIKLKSPYSHGCQTEIFINKIPVIIKRSCFLTSKNYSASFGDLFKAFLLNIIRPKRERFHVLYENGRLERGWVCKD